MKLPTFVLVIKLLSSGLTRRASMWMEVATMASATQTASSAPPLPTPLTQEWSPWGHLSPHRLLHFQKSGRHHHEAVLKDLPNMQRSQWIMWLSLHKSWYRHKNKGCPFSHVLTWYVLSVRLKQRYPGSVREAEEAENEYTMRDKQWVWCHGALFDYIQ